MRLLSSAIYCFFFAAAAAYIYGVSYWLFMWQADGLSIRQLAH